MIGSWDERKWEVGTVQLREPEGRYLPVNYGESAVVQAVTGTALLFTVLGSLIRNSSVEVWIVSIVSFTMEIRATMS